MQQQMSEFYQMAPEMQEIVRAALHDVMVNRPTQPIKFLARRLRELNDSRRIAELPAAAVERLRAQFEAADTNSSGKIGLDEYISIRRRTSRMDNAVVKEEDLRQDFLHIDADGCGGISFSEFLGSMLRAGSLPSGEATGTGEPAEAQSEVSEQEQKQQEPSPDAVAVENEGAAEQLQQPQQPSDESKEGAREAGDRRQQDPASN